MRILRYLTRDILLHTVAVSFVLFLVVFAGRFIRYLAEAAVGSLTGDVLLPIMLFKLPGFFEMILPLGLFIGILLSWGDSTRRARWSSYAPAAWALASSPFLSWCPR